MKNLPLLIITLLIAIVGCNSNKKNETNIAAQKTVVNKVLNPLVALEENVGGYIKDSIFFNNHIVDSTLQIALGKDLQLMKDEWNVPSSLNRAKNVIYITNCKTEKCSQSMWIVMINIARRQANVYHFEPKKITIYEGTQKLVIPEQIENYINNIKRNLKLFNVTPEIISAEKAEE